MFSAKICIIQFRCRWLNQRMINKLNQHFIRWLNQHFNSCHLELSPVRDSQRQRAMAEAATAAWLADTTTSGAMPWEAFTQTTELDADKDLYCVATWGILSVLAAPAFMRNSPGKATLQQLPRGQCVGVSMAVRMVWPLQFVAETLTVWHDRKHSTDFYRSDAHRRGMEALRGRVEFRARRVWVKAADLPRPGDVRSTEALWNAVKRGEHCTVGSDG